MLLGVHASPILELTPSDLSNSLTVLKRALDVGMFRASQTKFEMCDLVICPPNLRQFGIFDTKHLVAIEAAGYETALERMPAIQDIVDRSRLRA